MSELRITSEELCCRDCGKPLPLSAKPNTLYCNECACRRTLDNQKKWRKSHQLYIAKEAKETYEYYKSKGICTSCHNRPAVVCADGKQMTQCERCAEIRRNRNQKNRKRKRSVVLQHNGPEEEFHHQKITPHVHYSTRMEK